MSRRRRKVIISHSAAVPSAWPTWNGSLDGAVAVFSSGLAIPTAVAKLDTNKVIAIYEDAGGLDYGRAAVGTISGATITWGATVVFSGIGTINNSSVVALSTTKAMVCYRDTTDSNIGKAVILDISGTAITVNTAVNFAPGGIDAVSVAMLSASKAIVAYDETNVFQGQAMVLDVSGSTITTNAAFAFTATNTATNCVIESVSSTSAIVVYSDDDNLNFGTAKILTISGSTISGNAAHIFNSAVSLLFRIAKITSSIFAIVYDDGADSDFPAVQILSISGVTVSHGVKVRVINVAASDGYFAVAKADSQNAFILYRNVTTDRAAARIATISGTAITLQTPVVIKATACQAMAAANLDDTRVISVFTDEGNSGKGTGKVSRSA